MNQFKGFISILILIQYYPSIAHHGTIGAISLVSFASYTTVLYERLLIRKLLSPIRSAGMIRAFTGIVLIYHTSLEFSLSGTLLGEDFSFRIFIGARLILMGILVEFLNRKEGKTKKKRIQKKVSSGMIHRL